MHKEFCDVVVAGGGLSGLCFALQARREFPRLDIVVVDSLTRPLTSAAFKVGESTIEGGGYYLGEILGLHDLMMRRQLRKHGLRFFPGGGALPFELRPEIGPPCLSEYPTYQIDRGILENDLRELALAAGVRLIEGAVITEVQATCTERFLEFRTAGGVLRRIEARWLIDASGRRRLLASRLGLRRVNGHRLNSAWFRLPGRIDVSDFSNDPAWNARDPERRRYYSTNHLTGAGYWIWMIPLSSGNTSVGITFDEDLVAVSEFRDYATALQWVEKTEPTLFRHISEITPLDYRVLRNISYSTTQVFSADRWACIGEAALFQDPLYSLGTDFIGLSNLFAVDLLRRDEAGEELTRAAANANEVILILDEIALGFTRHNYAIFGKTPVLLAKLYWDAFLYWVVIAPFTFHSMQTVADAALESGILAEFAALQRDMQFFFRTWAAQTPEGTQARYYCMPPPGTILTDAYSKLRERLDAAGSLELMRRQLGEAHSLARSIRRRSGISSETPSDVAGPAVHDLELQYYHGELDRTRFQLLRGLVDLRRPAATAQTLSQRGVI
jgi:flavin-dependent dehydrogenase